MKTLLLVLLGSLVLVEGKLSGGSNEYEGRVEDTFEGNRYSICADGWDDKDAQVVCREHGYDTSNAKAFTNGEFGLPSASATLYPAIFKCDGDEKKLLNCEYPSAETCNSGTVAAVRCSKPAAGGDPAAKKPSQTAQSKNAGVQVVGGASLLLPLCLGVLCTYVLSP